MIKIQLLKRIRNRLIRIPRPLLLIFSVIIIILIGILDYYFNSTYNIYLLYLFPVIFISWTRGKSYGLFLSFFAIAVWLFSEILSTAQAPDAVILLINSALRISVYISIIFIISILNKLLKKTRDESRRDYLTNIPNIRAFFEYAQFEINRMKRNSKAFTLIYIDLDNFKHINDKMGHLEGNLLLRTTALIISHELRKVDLVARVGGDEFIVLLPETEKAQSKIVIDKIRSKLSNIFKKRNWPVTLSMGALAVINAPDSIEDAVKSADDLMYEAKKSGKNRVKYGEYK